MTKSVKERYDFLAGAGLLDTDISGLTSVKDLQLQAALAAARLEVLRIAQASNRFVCTGLALSPSATSGKLDLALGTHFNGTNEVNVAAQTAISTTVTSLASGLTAGQSLWVSLEITSSTVTFNSGSGAIAPVMPVISNSKAPLGLMWVPYGATTVDTDLTNINGAAKLYDVRSLRSGIIPSGWIHDQNSWLVASATSFTISGVDATGYLTPGTKVSYNDGSGIEYGVVASSSFSTDTTVNLIPNTDYSIAGSVGTALVRPRYSYAENPQSFPHWFNWDALPDTTHGWSANPGTAVYRWKTNGRSIKCVIRQGTNGTSNNASHTLVAPVTAKTITNAVWQTPAVTTDNNVVQTGFLSIISNQTVISCQGINTGTNTASGNSKISGQIEYEF